MTASGSSGCSHGTEWPYGLLIHHRAGSAYKSYHAVDGDSTVILDFVQGVKTWPFRIRMLSPNIGRCNYRDAGVCVGRIGSWRSRRSKSSIGKKKLDAKTRQPSDTTKHQTSSIRWAIEVLPRTSGRPTLPFGTYSGCLFAAVSKVSLA